MKQKENVENEFLQNEFFSLSEKKSFFKAKLFGKLATNQIIPSWLGNSFISVVLFSLFYSKKLLFGQNGQTKIPGQQKEG